MTDKKIIMVFHSLTCEIKNCMKMFFFFTHTKSSKLLEVLIKKTSQNNETILKSINTHLMMNLFFYKQYSKHFVWLTFCFLSFDWKKRNRIGFCHRKVFCFFFSRLIPHKNLPHSSTHTRVDIFTDVSEVFFSKQIEVCKSWMVAIGLFK